MSLAPTFSTHPRQIQRYRDVTPATGAIPSFMCKRGRHQCFVFAGRKKSAGGGWNCAECAGGTK